MGNKMITIREEQSQDIKSIHDLNKQAFGQTQEADLVDKLWKNCDDLLSLVALIQNEVVGHILFTPVMVEREGNRGISFGATSHHLRNFH